jgi:two-component system, chemotaxis family, sensor kinase CheA
VDIVEDKLNIELVDSSSFFRDMLAPVLKASGYRVHAASSAEDALNQLTGGLQVDVVVTALKLPDHSGLDLVAALRRNGHHSALPVIGLTMKEDPEQIALAHKFDVMELVSKVDRPGLLSALAELGPNLGKAA